MAKFPQHPRYVPIIKWQLWEGKGGRFIFFPNTL
ncbi:hypothetical protein J2W58_001413 [Pseudomonas psychrotolerans]|nr:hypothetical protein [Pseudomonas psychrotolerans]